MHRSRIGGIVIDCNCANLQEAAEFWSAALGYPIRKCDDLDAEKYIDFEVPPGEIAITVQMVDHPSRVHIDIETDDFEAETRRLVALGAKVIHRMDHWVTIEAPTGQRFCIVRQQRTDFSKNSHKWR